MNTKKILVIEDSIAMLTYEVEALKERFSFPILTASSMKEAEEILKYSRDDIFVALADLVLPDAPDGEIINLLIAHGIATIVFTGQYNEELRQFIMSKPIVDYILKSNLNNFQYALRLVAGLYENQFIRALVVDDSEFARLKIEFSLSRLQIGVVHASNINEAMALLSEHSDIRLVLTDYHMQSGNGIDLTSKIRQSYCSDKMTIIGYSSDTNKKLPIEFLKKGANDYIPYNYSEEEFTLRVIGNLELMAHLRMAREMAIKDFLTGLYNRRYLFETAKQLFHQVSRGTMTLGVAMIDIDFFKKINDEFGHDVGDLALKHIATLLEKTMRKSDLVTRFGGEEFCLLIVNVDNQQMFQIIENLRMLVENSPLHVETATFCTSIPLTISAGFTTKEFITIDEAIKESDIHLYAAKNQGRNCTCH